MSDCGFICIFLIMMLSTFSRVLLACQVRIFLCPVSVNYIFMSFVPFLLNLFAFSFLWIESDLHIIGMVLCHINYLQMLLPVRTLSIDPPNRRFH